MRTVRSFPRAVREVENVWIPLSDGSRLAARAWLPEDAERSPVPAIVEYLPYRKRDGTRARDEPMHRYFAGHGYASLRIDLRGSGDSDGLLLDEYVEQEQLDGVEAIRWAASRPWCTGAVGMIGKSWGGFNALQVAALRPPELRAVISVCSTDDRYADDAHYMGGCLLVENLLWGSFLFTLNGFPPDPELVGERWRAMWSERLEAAPLSVETWLAHQRRDAYWRHGSVCEDFGRIGCPVYAVGGWADAYSNAVPRLLAGLDVPCKGLVGPWAHVYPHDGVPGPAIGFLQEALRWWDRWLKGEPNGIEEEPAYRVWMQDPAPPLPLHRERPGRWVAEEAWPSSRIRARAYRFAARSLVEGAGAEAGSGETARVASSQDTGLDAGAWCGFGIEGESPGDQRDDDARSLCFDTAPLRERLEILGAPRVRLAFASDRPLAFVAARLNEVAPDGTSARVTYGLANLAHRSGHERPAPLVPGRRYEVEVALNDVAHAFAPGARVRVALSTSYWPIAWPSPEPAALTLHLGGCRLELPVRPPSQSDARLRPFERPEAAAPTPVTRLDPSVSRRTVERDAATGEVVVTQALDVRDDGAPALERMPSIDLVHGHGVVERFRIHPDDPLSARVEIEHRASFERGDWRVRVESVTRLACAPDAFLLDARLRAWEGEDEVCARELRRSLPRDHL